MVGNGEVIAYPVAVGKPGKQWTGVTRIDGKFASSRHGRRQRRSARSSRICAAVIPDSGQPGHSDGRRGHDAQTPGGEYAIHGTDDPASIGQFASFGAASACTMRDILDLYSRVDVGTPVVVVR